MDTFTSSDTTDTRSAIFTDSAIRSVPSITVVSPKNM